MDFSFNNWGRLSTGNKTFKFSDIDTDGDGKISKSEYNAIQELLKEQGEDIVNFANADRNKDQSIDENEFTIIEQKLKIQDHINQYKKIISVDFAGCSGDIMKTLNNEIKDYIDDYIDNYDGDVNELANSFINDFPVKYAELREQLLAPKTDEPEPEDETTPTTITIPDTKKNNTIDPGISALRKGYANNGKMHFELHNEYVYPVDDVDRFDSDVCGDVESALKKINGHRESFREQFVKQLGENFTNEIMKAFDVIYDSAAHTFINSLLDGKTYNEWESISSWDELRFNHGIGNEKLLLGFVEVLNETLNSRLGYAFSSAAVSADNIEVKNNRSHDDLREVLNTLNEYKEGFRAQLKTKLGVNYTAEVDKLFETVYSKSMNDVMGDFGLDSWHGSHLEDYYRNGDETYLSFVDIERVSTSEVLTKLAEVFNANMKASVAQVEYLNNPAAVSADNIELKDNRSHRDLGEVLNTLNEYKEDFRAQLKTKMGANYTAEMDNLFETVYSKSIKDVMGSFELRHGRHRSSDLEDYYRTGDEGWLSCVDIERVSTREVLTKFAEVFNTNMDAQVEYLNNPAAISADNIEISKNNNNYINNAEEILEELNTYKEQFRNQIKTKLGANYTSEIDKLFETVFSKTSMDLLYQLTSGGNRHLDDYFNKGETSFLWTARCKYMSTSEVLAKFAEVFNANMDAELKYLNTPAVISADHIEIDKPISTSSPEYVMKELNKYKEQFRSQIKSKAGANYSSEIDAVFEKVFTKSVKSCLAQFLSISGYYSKDAVSEAVDKYLNNSQLFGFYHLDPLDECIGTREILNKFAEIFNINMEIELKSQNITIAATKTENVEEEATDSTAEEEPVENTSNKFDDIFKEMQANVPDSTTTIDEKNLAISYIDKLLNSEDITPELKEYWQNKKEIIEQEILAIENQEAEPAGDSFVDVLKKFKRFTLRYKRNDLAEKTDDNSVEYNKTYAKVAISFIKRLLNCPDITALQKAEYTSMLEEYNGAL